MVTKVNTKGVEKRKFQRLDVPLNVTVKVITEDEMLREIKPQRVLSHNVSPQGICLETAQIVIDSVNMLSGSPGSRENYLELEIELKPGEPPVHVCGDVCWYDVARDTEEFMYQVGIVFTSFRDDARQRLAAFLKSSKKERGIFEKLLSVFNS